MYIKLLYTKVTVPKNWKIKLGAMIAITWFPVTQIPLKKVCLEKT